MFARKNLTFRRINALMALLATATLFNTISPTYAAPTEAASPKAPVKKDAAKDAKDKDKDKDEKSAATKTPEVVLENVVPVTADDLVNKPHDYLGKNVKFTASFYAFSNLALDYKPAFRSSKTHLSLLVLKPNTHIPLSELKLAMMIPKEKDPETELLGKLKDGDQVEIIGKTFSAALDDPWVEVFKLKKIGGSKDDDKKVAHESDKTKSDKTADKSDKSDKADKTTDKSDKSDEKPDSEGKSTK